VLREFWLTCANVNDIKQTTVHARFLPLMLVYVD
jgi:hypothetical protein